MRISKKVAVVLMSNPQHTVDSRYNEPRRKTKNSSLYREFVKSKIEKNLELLLKYLKNPV